MQRKLFSNNLPNSSFQKFARKFYIMKTKDKIKLIIAGILLGLIALSLLLYDKTHPIPQYIAIGSLLLWLVVMWLFSQKSS